MNRWRLFNFGRSGNMLRKVLKNIGLGRRNARRNGAMWAILGIGAVATALGITRNRNPRTIQRTVRRAVRNMSRFMNKRPIRSNLVPVEFAEEIAAKPRSTQANADKESNNQSSKQ